MSAIFLSYCRTDQADAKRLAEALTAAGTSVWWDHLIEGGASFAKRIESALDEADTVVVLWSAASIESDWVLDEAARGRDLRKLVPATLDGTPSPMGFRQYQTIDLSRWREGRDDQAIAMLVRGVRAMAATREATPGPTTPATAHSAVRRRSIDTARRRALVAGLAALPLAGVGWWGWRQFGSTTGAAPVGNSVAVLPFENLSGDVAQAYFSDGLSEEVRSTLARNLALKVMAKSSSSRFADSDQDATDIAAELGVAFLLDGTVRRAGDVVRVSADLIDGSTGFSRWSQTFERNLADVFAVQTEIALAVADALSAFVTGASTPRESLAAIGGTRSPAALDAYLRGRALYDLSTDEATDRAALALFDLALATDPAFASGHAARARALTAIANQYGRADELAALYAAAIAAAQRAIALAPDLAEAHSTLGFTLFQGQLDARAARAPFERSIELGAGEATVLARFALFAARTGRHEDARRSLAPALLRDPLNPLIHRAAGGIAYAARRFEDSLAPLRKALTMNPKLTRAHAAIGDALLNLGDIDGALAAYPIEPSTDMRLVGLAIAHRRAMAVAASPEARSTHAAKADEAEAALVASGDRVLYQQAQVRAQARDPEAAFARLAGARALGDSGLIYARNDPFLDPLRGDTRFAALLDSIGFDVPAPGA